MGGWRGLLQPLLRGHKVRNKGFSTYPRPLPPTMARHIQPAESCRSVGYPACSRLLYSNVVRRFCTSKGKADGKEGPVRSPLTMVPSLTDDKDKKTLTQAVEKRPVQAVLKKIKQSPKKVNLVAALVRGMRVEDAILQLTVLRKRAAKTVKRVVANARANATHNHGLNGDKLFVDEAFVGKGRYLKRISYHAKGRSGIMHHPSCRLTVIVKELTDKQEAELARYKTMHFRERAKFRSRLVPHKLIETSSYWDRIPKGQPGSVEATTPT